MNDDLKPGDRVQVWLGGHGDQRIYGYGHVHDHRPDGYGVLLEGDWEDEGRVWRTSRDRIELVKDAA